MSTKQIAIALIFISLIGLVVAIWWKRTTPAKTDRTPAIKTTTSKPAAEIMRELRIQWLTRKPSIDPEVKKDEVSAVLMDWPLDQATVTVLASSAGDASIYSTGTFGIMGGIGHENVRKAAISLIECAKMHLSLASPTSDYSYPDPSHIRFFFVTKSGVLSVTFPATEVEKTGTDAYDLYAHGQAVLTELRQITQKQRGY
jgi:hypothetical protein